MSAPSWATHYGWFGLCPIWIEEFDDGSVRIEPRHWSLGWLMSVSDALVGAWIWLYSLTHPDWEPVFPIKVTGELAWALKDDQ